MTTNRNKLKHKAGTACQLPHYPASLRISHHLSGMALMQ